MKTVADPRPSPVTFEMLQGPWHIHLFGRLRAVNADRPIDRFRTEKTASLLAYLALHLGQSFSRDSLIELLWPEADLDRGRMSLRTALSSLRRQLEPPGVPSGAVLRATPSAVSLHPSSVRTDVDEFERLIAFAATASDDSERASRNSEAVD